MASEPKGRIVVPSWVDGGEVKPLVNDAGEVPVAADISGQTVDISGQVVNIDGATPYALLMSLYAGAWRKNPIVWGFTEIYAYVDNFTCVAGGVITRSFGTVVAGRIASVTGFSVYRSVNVPTLARLAISNGVTTISMNDFTLGVAGQVYGVVLPCVLPSQWFVSISYFGCTVGEQLISHAWGYQMGYDL